MRNFQCLWPARMLSIGKFAKRNCKARLGFPSLGKHFFSSVPHTVARTPVSQDKIPFNKCFKNQVKLLLVVITASDIARSGNIFVSLYLSEFITQVYNNVFLLNVVSYGL